MRRLIVKMCLLTLAVGVPVWAQQGAIKDPSALALMNSCVQASGGTQAISSIQDFVASGTVTFNWDSSIQASATLKGRLAANEFRFDASLSNGTRSWSVSNGTGVLIDFDQSRSAFQYQTALSLRSITWPVADFLPALSDPNAAISYLGLTSLTNGTQAYQVHIQETYASGTDPTGALSAASARDYFIDPKTSLIVSVKNTQAFGTPPQNYPEQLFLSGYASANGVVVPFTISELVAGQQTWTVQLNTITFNVNLIDADFQL